MPHDPVIIDDGGSTRIEQLNKTLDRLLWVSPVNHQSHDRAAGPFGNITVLSVGLLPPKPLSVKMRVGDSFEVFSGQFRVHGKIVGRRRTLRQRKVTIPDCEVTVKGVRGAHPVMMPRQNGQQRRYIVTNAPAIEKVVITASGRPVPYRVPKGTRFTEVVLDR